MWRLLLLISFHLLNGHPIAEKTSLQKRETTLDQTSPPNVVSYIQNFRNLMIHYVIYVQTDKYNLTDSDMKVIQKALEEFLINFSSDLKNTVMAGKKNVTFEKHPILQDGLPDSTFEDIKTKLRTEFPELKEETVDEIVYKLRDNLYRTKLAIKDNVKISNTSDVL